MNNLVFIEKYEKEILNEIVDCGRDGSRAKELKPIKIYSNQ